MNKSDIHHSIETIRHFNCVICGSTGVNGALVTHNGCKYMSRVCNNSGCRNELLNAEIPLLDSLVNNKKIVKSIHKYKPNHKVISK